MKKTLKAIISSVLILATCFSYVTSAFAVNSVNNTLSSNSICNEISKGVYKIEYTNSDMDIIASSLDNGDTELTLSQNGTVISKTYVHQSSRTVTYTPYENGVPGDSINVSAPQPTSVSQMMGLMATPVTYLGRMQFSTNQGLKGASLYYNEAVNSTGQYNLNGTYQDLAMLLGIIIATIGVTYALASTIASIICAWCSVPLAFSNAIIPDYFISATTTTMDWKIYDSNNYNNYSTFSGVKYLITQTGYSPNTYYEGDYYVTSDYYNHNYLFAQRVFNTLWDGPFTVYSWS